MLALAWVISGLLGWKDKLLKYYNGSNYGKYI
jgi:hypothetical protein